MNAFCSIFKNIHVPREVTVVVISYTSLTQETLCLGHPVPSEDKKFPFRTVNFEDVVRLLGDTIDDIKVTAFQGMCFCPLEKKTL